MNAPAPGLSALCVPLDAALDAGVYGGKAAALGRLLRAGLPVPPGYAIAASPIGEGAQAVDSLPEAFVASGPLAVRSSAVGEDGADASFAGQHLTRLGIAGRTALVEAVAAVRASAATAHARRYRARMQAGDAACMGVVVQRMIDADCAGVLFTRDPVNGRAECIVEAVAGLGETLVSGTATPAHWRLDAQGRLLAFAAGEQAETLRLGADGQAQRRRRADARITQDCLDDAQLAALQALGRRCEQLFGAPQDLEWAIAGGRIWLLQSRPITTLASAEPALDPLSPGVLHGDPGSDILWTRVNVSEAVPGVVTPLTAEFHRDSFELSPQRMFRRMGVGGARVPRRPRCPEERPSAFVCGRAVANVDFLRRMADAIPGTSGDALEEAMFGRVRPGVASRPRRTRYPIVALKMAWIVATLPRRLLRLHDATHAWWREQVTALDGADLRRSVAVFEQSCERYARIIDDHGLIAALSAGFWDPVARLVRQLGDDDDLLALTAGYGTVREAQMLQRLWDVSRGCETLEDFIAEYGYMTPQAGELAARSWREDRRALEQSLAHYRAQPEHDSPAARQRRTRTRYEATRAKLLRRATPVLRVALRASLALAGRMLPMREVGKASMVLGTDVARAAARRAGRLLVARGDIDTVDDVLQLTREELRAAVDAPADRRGIVAGRRALHAACAAVPVPDFFTGRELQALAAAPPADVTQADGREVRGVGVSRGCARGAARVIRDPGEAARLRPGEILVCHMTDPAWSALFSVAGAIVVDIGGMLSHAAIIARELGIPAVVNTRDGTRRIADGAALEVDGGRGIVRLLTDRESGS